MRRSPRRTRVGLVPLACVAGFFSSACGILSVDDSPSAAESLAENRALWESLSIDSYQYRLSKSCECLAGLLGPVIITVQDGVIAGVVQALNGHAVEEENWPSLDTVEDLFDLVGEAVEQGAYQLEVEYDEERGYPTLINVDSRKEMADDELFIHASDLSPGGPGA